ncbi:MAG: hypothetical protein HYS67_01645, partial [Deltaproteobacteria bacterium]|nr:hypothetical protein [Deltaproteobacteria bacterium]
MRLTRMTRLFPACVILLFLAADSSPALENLRVAYPSVNTSVFALVIAQKEGY